MIFTRSIFTKLTIARLRITYQNICVKSSNFIRSKEVL